MNTLVLYQTGFIFGYMGNALMQYTITKLRSYWQVRDGKGRLVALTMRWHILGKKMPYDPSKLPTTLAA